MPFMFEGKILRKAAISLRRGGDMGLCGNSPETPTQARRRFYETLGIDEKKVFFARQIHSKEIAIIDEGVFLRYRGGFVGEADGLVSLAPEAFLAVTVADCLPVLLYDVKTGIFAALHSGWRGTGIVTEALRRMTQSGSAPADIAAVLGPCISGGAYRVDAERAALFDKEFGGGQLASYPLGPVSGKHEAGGFFVDLKAANAALLAEAGVKNIAYCTACTCTDTRLGSFRREGADAYTKMLVITGNIHTG
ncbi:MAG: polyphenol oxidase family protein [Spirochaetaceae bacterium]|jgi:YfiH family protein|nr:polyphenol oxidase family protein [Spirochaetaceae bacterium]